MLTKVVIAYGNTKIDYDLNREESLQYHISIFCTRFQVPGPASQYCLQIESSKVYLEEGDLHRVEVSIPVGSVVVFKLKPLVAVEAALAAITDAAANPKQRAIQIFEIRNALKDEAYCREFLQRNGISELTKIIGSVTGNALAYSLSAMNEAMGLGFGWDDLPQKFIDDVVALADSSNLNLNVCRSALEILLHICLSPKYGFKVLEESFGRTAKQKGKQQYHILVQLLGSTDLNIQSNALTLVDSMIEVSRSTKERLAFTRSLDILGINHTLKKNLNSTDLEFRHQMYIYQRKRLEELKLVREEPYNREDESHENMLMKLWKFTFPNTTLESRISEQWKLIGFQGTDPATDFRGMGLLGLQNLVYFAESHTETFRKIVTVQAERKERDYPVAVAGINITQMLFDLFQISKPVDLSKGGIIFNVLFDHPNAFEEVYCIAFRVLDSLWDEMMASYMDFPRVIAAVKKQMGDVLGTNPSTIDQVNRGATWSGPRARSQSSSLAEDEDEIAEPEPLKVLRAQVKQEMLDLVKKQKKSFIQQGCSFRVYKPKAKQAAFMYCKLVDSQLMYGPLASLESAPEEPLPSSLAISECQSISIGINVPAFSKQKKLTPQEEDVAALSFTVHTEDPNKYLELVALNAEDYSNWTDGLRVLLHDRIENQQSMEEFKVLVSLELRVRLLDLAGIEIPQEPPAIPPPPSNHNFVTS